MPFIDLTNRDKAIQMLLDRGITIEDIAEVTLEIQKDYYEHLTLEECVRNVHKVLEKTEVQNVVFTGIALDIMCEKGLLPDPLSEMVSNDAGLFGVDEILALGIVNVYGSIGLTNFGYVDKAKIGIIKEIDEIGKKEDKCMTFMDDIVGALAAASASRIAHNMKNKHF